MRPHALVLIVFATALLLPSASAEALVFTMNKFDVPVVTVNAPDPVCPEYNPLALTNACVSFQGSVSTAPQPVSVPTVGTGPTLLCVIGNIGCVPSVVIGHTQRNVPGTIEPFSANGFVEVTLLCRFSSACHVDFPPEAPILM